jgi:hypothetical protein
VEGERGSRRFVSGLRRHTCTGALLVARVWFPRSFSRAAIGLGTRAVGAPAVVRLVVMVLVGSAYLANIISQMGQAVNRKAPLWTAQSGKREG